MLAMFAMTSGMLAAQDAALRGRATLVGVVRDSAFHVVSDAVIGVLDRQARTNALGAFRIAALPPGTTTLTVRRIGYVPATYQVTLRDGDTLTARLTLARIVSLDSIEVTARSGIGEFEERRLHGQGTFITRADLDKYTWQGLPDVLFRVPGLRIAGGRGNEYAITGRGQNWCYSQVYVDNVPVYRKPPDLPFNLSTVPLGDIAGIEYYRGGATAPAKYLRPGSSCGVLVIWTRR